jgi:hypothetical protein
MGKHALHVPLEFATAIEVKSRLGKFAHFHNSVFPQSCAIKTQFVHASRIEITVGHHWSVLASWQ